MPTSTMTLPNIVSRDEWLGARKKLLVKEKELNRQRDAVNAARRRLPMVRVEKDYVWQGSIGYEIRDLVITAGENAAFAHSLNRLSGTKTSGEKSEVWLRHTLCFRQIRGEWKIAHAHESVPFYMDGTYKAAVDLKP